VPDDTPPPRRDDDDWDQVRVAVEVHRVSALLAGQFSHVDPLMIEERVRAGYEARTTAHIQDFVAVFVERAVRADLRDRT
jgi:hypothetical protein